MVTYQRWLVMPGGRLRDLVGNARWPQMRSAACKRWVWGSGSGQGRAGQGDGRQSLLHPRPFLRSDHSLELVANERCSVGARLFIEIKQRKKFWSNFECLFNDVIFRRYGHHLLFHGSKPNPPRLQRWNSIQKPWHGCGKLGWKR